MNEIMQAEIDRLRTVIEGWKEWHGQIVRLLKIGVCERTITADRIKAIVVMLPKVREALKEFRVIAAQYRTPGPANSDTWERPVKLLARIDAAIAMIAEVSEEKP